MGKGKIVKVTGIKNQGRTATVLLRGSNKLVLEEAERSLHDALCVVRCLVHKRFLIPGGAAPEVELNVQLSRWAKSLVVSPLPQNIAHPAWMLIPAMRCYSASKLQRVNAYHVIFPFPFEKKN